MLDSWPMKDGRPIIKNTNEAFELAKVLIEDVEALSFIETLYENFKAEAEKEIDSGSMDIDEAFKKAFYCQFLREALEEVQNIIKKRIDKARSSNTFDCFTAELKCV